MKKLLLFITLAAAPLLFTACDEDDPWHYENYPNDGWGYNGDFNNGNSNNNSSNQSLSSAELALVGSYVTNDGQEPVIYLTLNQDRTGNMVQEQDGNTTSSNFTWYAENSQLYFYYSNDQSDYEVNPYYTADGILYINNVPLAKNNGSSSGTTTTTSPLIGQWEGTITDYYLAEYPDLDSTGNYATIIEYANDGTGAQLDYEVTDPQGNYCYMPFQWTKFDNVIMMYYGENIPSSTVQNYALTTTKFSGQMVVGRDPYPFVFAKTSGFDWSVYTRGATTTKANARTLLRQLKAQKAKRTAVGKFAK